ncbi:MAG: response regulator [Pseudomonadota bacterium]
MQSAPAVVLVVEDEILIRMDVVDQLAEIGFAVLEAGSGQEALAIIESEERVDVVFTDVDMPGSVNGIDLARTVDERWPTIAIIVTSGQAIIRADELPAGSLFYPKPYQSAKVHQAIQELLA